MLDTSPLRLSIGENVETLLRAHFILVSYFAPFHYSQGLEQLEVRLPKKNFWSAPLYQTLPLDEENWFGWVIPKASLGIILSKYRV